MLVGNNVYLRVIEREDIHLVRRWRNSPDVYQFMANRDLIMAPQQEGWYERVLTQPKNVFLLICATSDDAPIGVVNLKDVDHRNQHAEAGIYIAEVERREHRLGREAFYLILEYGFSYLNLHKSYAHVLVDNEVALRMYRSFGFQVEGTLRDEIYFDGRFHDYYRISVLKDEFYQAPSTQLFATS